MKTVREYLELPDAGAPTGAGVRIAVVDTGIDVSHSDLENAYCREHSCDLSNSSYGLEDTHEKGHGTHVAGIIAGSGKRSNGVHRGIAPDATIIVIKLIGGAGVLGSFPIALHRAALAKADIVNMSLGLSPDETDPPWVFYPDTIDDRCFADAARQGLLCVAAAGNEGPSRGTINYPAGLASVLAVGAIDHRVNRVDDTSSRGPYRWSHTASQAEYVRYDGTLSSEEKSLVHRRIKPDVCAPGADISAPLLTRIAEKRDTLGGVDEYDGAYHTLSGTSQATAVVSGLSACLLEYLRNGGVSLGPTTGETLRRLLISAASRDGGKYGASDVGYGVLRWPAIRDVANKYIQDAPYRRHVLGRVKRKMQRQPQKPKDV